MNTKGRPKKDAVHAKREFMQFRANSAEKQTMKDAAMVAGVDLSTWIRERLLRAARRELEEAGRRIPYLDGK